MRFRAGEQLVPCCVEQHPVFHSGAAILWKSVSDRATFSRGSKFRGRGWLLLIKTWSRRGFSNWRVSVRKNRTALQVEGDTTVFPSVTCPMLLHITSMHCHGTRAIRKHYSKIALSHLARHFARCWWSNQGRCWCIFFIFHLSIILLKHKQPIENIHTHKKCLQNILQTFV